MVSVGVSPASWWPREARTPLGAFMGGPIAFAKYVVGRFWGHSEGIYFWSSAMATNQETDKKLTKKSANRQKIDKKFKIEILNVLLNLKLRHARPKRIEGFFNSLRGPTSLCEVPPLSARSHLSL